MRIKINDNFVSKVLTVLGWGTSKTLNTYIIKEGILKNQHLHFPLEILEEKNSKYLE